MGNNERFLAELLPGLSGEEQISFFATMRDRAIKFIDHIDSFEASGVKSIQQFIMSGYDLTRDNRGIGQQKWTVSHLAEELWSGAYNVMRQFAYNLYFELTEISNSGAGITWRDAEGAHRLLSEFPVDAFEAYVYDETALFIRTPFVSRRQKSGRGIKEAKREAHIYNLMVAEGAARTIQDSPDLDSLELDRFEHMHVHILFVFGEPSANIADCDSYDIRTLIDTVTSFVGGDNAYRCSVSISTAICPDIPSGTYITVTAGSMGAAPPDEFIVNYWREHLQTRQSEEGWKTYETR